MKKLKIAIVVHGRFHAFDLARALLTQGHDVTLFTNYPKWAVARFGIDPAHVRSLWLHGVAERAFQRAERYGLQFPEARLHQWFGRWAARSVPLEKWDAILSWSGISEELLLALEGRSDLVFLTRGSAHIRTQSRLLLEEEERTKAPLNRPRPWMIAREEREYALADHILVLSSFARNTFIAEGISSEKLRVTPLGVDTTAFRPDRQIVEARCRRILEGQPLRILYTGSRSFQKGMWDMVELVQKLYSEGFRFRLVGASPMETQRIIHTLAEKVELVPSQPQEKLPEQYAWGDIYLFPTIQDGFAVVLTQATASALPIIATTNCSAPDFIREGQSGWIVPIRDPDAIIERLRWCDNYRMELVKMVRDIYDNSEPYTWLDSARDFVQVATECLQDRA